jgi:hypothetical protein
MMMMMSIHFLFFSLNSSSEFQLKVDYSRYSLPQSTTTSSTNVAKVMTTNIMDNDNNNGTILYILRCKINESSNDDRSSNNNNVKWSPLDHKDLNDPSTEEIWDLESIIDITSYVKCANNCCNIGIDAIGLLINESRQSIPSSSSSSAYNNSSTSTYDNDYNNIHQNSNKNISSSNNNNMICSSYSFKLYSLSYQSNNTINTYPITSSYTSSRYPDTYLYIQKEINQFRCWMNIKLKLLFPPMFKVIYDRDSINNYEKIFTFIMRVS